MRICLIVFIFLMGGSLATGDSTWEYSHSELVSIFNQSFTAWPMTKHTAQLPVNQPSMVIGPTGDLFVNSYSLLGFDIGWVASSTDGGVSWAHIGTAMDFRFVPIPPGHILLAGGVSGDGIGVTPNGTLLGLGAVQYNTTGVYVGPQDPNYHVDAYVMRSTDNGGTWSAPLKLNTAPNSNAGGNRTRFAQLPGGVMALALPVWNQSATGDPLPIEDLIERTYLFTSSDDGQSWQRGAEPIALHGEEPDLLVLDSGRMLATLRYQRAKLPSDFSSLASPRDGSTELGVNVIRNMAILWSDDNGATWTEPRLMTALDEQTGCLVQLSDGTVLMVFGTKNDGLGQRFMVSYDEGETWSRTVYHLHTGGMYASSVALADDTVVTILDDRPVPGLTLAALRWTPPTVQEVTAGGFWTPAIVEPLGQPDNPTSCQEVIAFGYGLAADLDGDCYITLADLALQVGDWLRCIDPIAGNCERP
jgi:hypothetical protein